MKLEKMWQNWLDWLRIITVSISQFNSASNIIVYFGLIYFLPNVDWAWQTSLVIMVVSDQSKSWCEFFRHFHSSKIQMMFTGRKIYRNYSLLKARKERLCCGEVAKGLKNTKTQKQRLWVSPELLSWSLISISYELRTLARRRSLQLVFILDWLFHGLL